MSKYKLALVLLTFIVSCTITNRKYMPGYSVSWLGNVKESSSTSKEFKAVKNETDSPASIFDIPQNIVSSSIFHLRTKNIQLVERKNKIESKVKTVSVNKNIDYNLTPKSTFENINPIDSIKAQNNTKTMEANANKSILWGLLSWASVLLILLSFLFAFGLGLYIFFFLGVALAIMGFIFGLKALKIIKNQPEKYEGKSRAIVGIIFSIVFLIAAIVLVAQL